MKIKKIKKAIFRRKDVNLTSKEWCDIIFEGRNKSYGAYDMRKNSSKRHILAFILVFLSFAAIIYVPRLVEYISDRMAFDKMMEVTKLSNIEFEKDPEDIIPKDITPPPMTPTVNKKKATDDNPAEIIKTTVPMIVPEKEFEEKAAMPTFDELKDIPDTAKIDTIDFLDDALSEKYTVEDIYTEVDKMPAFPGGEQGLAEFIAKNIVYPSEAFRKGIQGSLICTFIIEKNGSVTHEAIKEAGEPSLNKEALRVIKMLPKWEPGKRHGKPVRVKYTLPFIFNLQ